MSGSAPTKPTTGTQLMGAGRNIVIAAVVLGVVYFFYQQYVNTSKQLKTLHEKVLELVKHDSPVDYHQSIKLLDQGLALRPDPWFLAARGDVSALLWVEEGETSDKADAEKFTEQAIAKHVNRGERFDAQALVDIGDGKLDQANDVLNGVVEKTAGTAAIVADLGVVHERLGKSMELVKNDFKQAADRDWVNPRFNALYADALFDAGEFANAQNIFQKALESSPNHARSIIGKVRADVARQQQVAEGAKTIDEVLGNPDVLTPMLKVRALAAKAEIQLANNDAAGAEATAHQAIDMKVADTGSGYAQYDLGLALALQKKPGALDAIKEAIVEIPFISRFYFDGALTLAKADDTADAGKLLDQYALKITDASGKLKPDDAYHRARGDLYVLAKDWDNALKEYDLSIKDNPVSADSYYKEAVVDERKAEAADKKDKKDKLALYNSALDSLSKATGFRQRFPDAYREAGMIYLEGSPDDPKAMENFTKALLFYKDQKVPKSVTDEFIDAVAQRLEKFGAKFKKKAQDWRDEAGKALTP